MKKKKPAKKRTSKRVAKIAAKYLDMTDAELELEAGLCLLSGEEEDWSKFCRRLRSICGSVVSQKEK